MTYELDDWLPGPDLRVAHARASSAAPDDLWGAARSLRIGDSPVLGRLIQWRIPDTPRELRFDALFRTAPFMVLAEHERALVSGLVGRIWTLRRDYPQLDGADAFRAWSQAGTARVVIATWVSAGNGGTGDDGAATLHSEARVQALGAQGQLGVAAVRPLVRAFEHLIGTEALRAAVRSAEQEAGGA